MSNRKSGGTGAGGMGVGYVSLVMIFSVICLTVLAVLSYQAAGANDILNEKSGRFTGEYYSADSSAKQTLCRLDEIALTSTGGFFEDDFTALCGEALPEVRLRSVPEGVEASFTEPINDRLRLDVSVIFYSRPSDSRYSITEWKSVSAAQDETDEALGVWDGSMFN